MFDYCCHVHVKEHPQFKDLKLKSIHNYSFTLCHIVMWNLASQNFSGQSVKENIFGPKKQ
jgi:hypothetical protein